MVYETNSKQVLLETFTVTDIYVLHYNNDGNPENATETTKASI